MCFFYWTFVLTLVAMVLNYELPCTETVNIGSHIVLVVIMKFESTIYTFKESLLTKVLH